MKVLAKSGLCSFICVLLTGFFWSGPFAGEYDGLRKEIKKRNFQLNRRFKATKENLVAVRANDAFNTFYAATASQDEATMKTSLASINKYSLQVYKRRKMDEMCLIGHIPQADGSIKGPEVARIVGNEIAPPSELSPDESTAPFYWPTFKLKNKEVRIQEPYMSPDSRRWVIAYTTPIVMEDGTIPSFLHYEKYWGEYLKVLYKKLKGKRILVVGQNALLYADSEKSPNLEKRKEDPDEEKEEVADYFAPLYSAFSDFKQDFLKSGSVDGKVTLDGQTYRFASDPMSEFGMRIILLEKI